MHAMDLEHCVSYGHGIPFTTPNYQITTTPCTEWGIVVRGERPLEEHRGHGRTILDLALDRHWASPGKLLMLNDNAEIEDPTEEGEKKRMRMARTLATEASLQQSEVAAVILYTGPMVCAQPI
jgi:hypothetical protein